MAIQALEGLEDQVRIQVRCLRVPVLGQHDSDRPDLLKAEEKELGVVVVSPHAPERKKTLRAMQEKGWISAKAVAKAGDNKYVIVDLFNRCTQPECKCPNHTAVLASEL